MAQNHEDQGRFKSFTRRTLLLAGRQGLMLLSLLAGRMYYLQVLESDRYRVTLAEENRINLRLLPPPARAHRRPLRHRAGPVNQQQLPCRPGARAAARRGRATLDRSGHQVIDLSAGDRKRILRETKRKRSFVPVTVRDNLELGRGQPGSRCNTPDLPGDLDRGRRDPQLSPGARPWRMLWATSRPFPKSDLTGDPLLELPGFRIGKNGIERALRSCCCAATAGTSQVRGQCLRPGDPRDSSATRATPGQRGWCLTLDAGLQNYVHQRLMSERSRPPPWSSTSRTATCWR